MRWKGGSRDDKRWRNLYALFPVHAGGSDLSPIYCWFEWFEWRWKEWPTFERRFPGAEETVSDYVTLD